MNARISRAQSAVPFKATRVCVESPLSGDIEINVLYADACMLDCLKRGEAPFLGHLLYTRVLNDQLAIDRQAGISAHLEWLRVAEIVTLYTDFGQSHGMRLAADLAFALRIPIEYRELGEGWRERIESARRATPGFFLRQAVV